MGETTAQDSILLLLLEQYFEWGSRDRISGDQYRRPKGFFMKCKIDQEIEKALGALGVGLGKVRGQIS